MHGVTTAAPLGGGVSAQAAQGGGGPRSSSNSSSSAPPRLFKASELTALLILLYKVAARPHFRTVEVCPCDN